MTGTCNTRRGDIPVAYATVGSKRLLAARCSGCGKLHTYDFAKPSNILFHKDIAAQMCKATHVRPSSVYEVSPRMLRLERSQTCVSGWKIDDGSMALVLELSETARKTPTRTSFAAQNWPVVREVNFDHADPPYIDPPISKPALIKPLPDQNSKPTISHKKSSLKSDLQTPTVIKTKAQVDNITRSQDVARSPAVAQVAIAAASSQGEAIAKGEKPPIYAVQEAATDVDYTSTSSRATPPTPSILATASMLPMRTQRMGNPSLARPWSDKSRSHLAKVQSHRRVKYRLRTPKLRYQQLKLQPHPRASTQRSRSRLGSVRSWRICSQS